VRAIDLLGQFVGIPSLRPAPVLKIGARVLDPGQEVAAGRAGAVCVYGDRASLVLERLRQLDVEVRVGQDRLPLPGHGRPLQFRHRFPLAALAASAGNSQR
jgi:hypothetical protein